MKKQAIAKLGKENHLNGLMARLPFLTTIYGIQCLLIYHMVTEINASHFAVSLGLMLIGLVTSLFIYDKYHHVLLYQDHLLVYFEPLNTAKKILYEDIQEIVVPENECDFSSIMLKLKNEQNISFHFIDYPHEVKQVITDLINQKYDTNKLAA